MVGEDERVKRHLVREAQARAAPGPDLQRRQVAEALRRLSTESENPSPGWYPDEEHPFERRRFWDGAAWTERTREIESHYVRHPQDPPQQLGPARNLALAGLAAVALIEAFNAFAALNYAGVVGELIGEGQPPLSEIESADGLITGAGWAVLAGYLAIGPITFIPWFARAYSNLPRLGILPLRFRAGQAVWAWFVPLLNLIRPKQIADDIYRGSLPGAPANRGFRELGVSPLLHWWWGTFLTALVLGRIATGMINGAADDPLATQAATIELLEQQRAGLFVSAIASVVAIAAAALAVAVVIRITRAQTTAIERAH